MPGTEEAEPPTSLSSPSVAGATIAEIGLNASFAFTTRVRVDPSSLNATTTTDPSATTNLPLASIEYRVPRTVATAFAVLISYFEIEESF